LQVLPVWKSTTESKLLTRIDRRNTGSNVPGRPPPVSEDTRVRNM
jgi:hypothetical protein